jgi:SNF2 family DNA or RNA helicase
MNSIASLRNHLEMFQNIFSDALTADSPFTQQPQHITTPLRAHQLSALYSMRQKELALRTGYKVPGSDHTLFSQYAFLGDRTGVGKTFMVLGHISQMSLEPLTQHNPMSNLHSHSTSSCFSISPATNPTTLYDSLVVVPHTIYRQWQDTVKKTTLKAVFLKSLRDLDKDNLVTNLEGAHLTLISNTLLPLFMNSMRARNLTPTWRRVFYDEADTIKISSTVEAPLSLMTWYVTASYNNLLFTNQYYHSFVLRQLSPEFITSLHPKLQALIQTYTDNHPVVTFFKTQSNGFFMSRIKSQHPLRSSLVIINSDEFLDTSVRLPPLISQVIRCETPVSQRIIQNAISTEVESMLNAGDIQGVLQSLGISSHTNLTIVDAVCEAKIKEKERLERLLAFKQNETYATVQAKEAAITALEEKIQRVKVQIDDIKARVESNDTCSICFDTQDNPVITPCCSKIFCASCILPWMTRNMACPLCRVSFHPSSLRAIGAQSIPRGPQSRLPKKTDALIKILEDNPEGKFLVFSRYENPLFALYERLSTSYTSATLQGNKDVIAHLLDNFAKGTTKILFLNSRNAAAGINIPAATHVILLHKMAQEEEKQILGRAYRMGRTSPLNFIQLLTERE